MEENVQQEFDVFEQEKIKEAEQEKIIWFGEKHLPFKQRLYQFIATVVVVFLKTITMTPKGQFWFVVVLFITVPVGLYTSVKWIFNLFF